MEGIQSTDKDTIEGKKSRDKIKRKYKHEKDIHGNKIICYNKN